MEGGCKAVLRVKRKRSAEPAEALVLAYKRLRGGEEPSETQQDLLPLGDAVEKNVFQLVATVRSQVEETNKRMLTGRGGGDRWNWGACVRRAPIPPSRRAFRLVLD